MQVAVVAKMAFDDYLVRALHDCRVRIIKKERRRQGDTPWDQLDDDERGSVVINTPAVPKEILTFGAVPGLTDLIRAEGRLAVVPQVARTTP